MFFCQTPGGMCKLSFTCLPGEFSGIFVGILDSHPSEG